MPASAACGVGVVALERGAETRSQPRDHRDIHRIGLGDLGQRLARSAALDGFLALEVRKLRLAAELDASGLCALATSAIGSAPPSGRFGG